MGGEAEFFPRRTNLRRSGGPRGGARAQEGEAETRSKFAAATEERQWNLAQVMMEAVVKTTIGWMGIFSHILYITVDPLPYHKFHFSPLEDHED
jgi:hypothetical protein